MEIIPQKYKILSGSMLKTIAAATMIIDHIAFNLLRECPIGISVMGKYITLYSAMRKIGRFAFPIYCFLLVEGFLYTHDRKKYGIRLITFALISEIPWNLVHKGGCFYSRQNVLFTLFMGYLGICCIEFFRENPKRLVGTLSLIYIVTLFLKSDYGVKGFVFVIMFYILREKKILQALLGCCFLSSTWVGGMAFIPINLYNGKRGYIRIPILQYFFILCIQYICCFCIL